MGGEAAIQNAAHVESANERERVQWSEQNPDASGGPDPIRLESNMLPRNADSNTKVVESLPNRTRLISKSRFGSKGP